MGGWRDPGLPGLPSLPACPTHRVPLLHPLISFHEIFSKFRTLMSPLFQLEETESSDWSSRASGLQSSRATGEETDGQSHYCGHHNYMNDVKLPENLA